MTLLERRCEDIEAGLPNAEGAVLELLTPAYTLEELDAMGFWENIDAEIASRETCDLPSATTTPTPSAIPTPIATPTPTPTPLPVGDLPMCRIKASGKQLTKLVAPEKVQKQLVKSATMGECASATNGRVMCKSRREKMSSVMVPHSKVQKMLAKGLTLGVCRGL
jgi:hypothetical protein